MSTKYEKWTRNLRGTNVKNFHIFLRFQHEIELSIILKYSPFKTEKDLLDYFDKIKTKGSI